MSEADIKKILADGKAVIGTDETLKGLRKNGIKRIFVTKNAPEMVKNDLAHYSKLAGVSLSDLDLTNEELGVLCKKNYAIAVISEKR